MFKSIAILLFFTVLCSNQWPCAVRVTPFLHESCFHFSIGFIQVSWISSIMNDWRLRNISLSSRYLAIFICMILYTLLVFNKLICHWGHISMKVGYMYATYSFTYVKQLTMYFWMRHFYMSEWHGGSQEKEQVRIYINFGRF